MFTVVAGIASIKSAWWSGDRTSLPIDLCESRASHYYTNGEYLKSIIYYDKALSFDPLNSEYWLGKSHCYLALECGRCMLPRPDRTIADYHIEASESEYLKKAYECAERSITTARDDFQLVKAHSICGLIVYSIGCDDFCKYTGLSRFPVFPGGGRRNPFHSFVKSVTVFIQNIEYDEYLTSREWGQVCAYYSMANAGIEDMIKRSDNNQQIHFREYLKKYDIVLR